MIPTVSSMRCLGRRRMLALGVASLAAPAIARPMHMRVGGNGAALGGLDLLAPGLQAGRGLTLETVRLLGTVGGIRGVTAGRLEASVASRPLTEAELASGLRARLYATTPLVFATRRDNPAEGLSLPRAEAMVAGDIPFWPDGTPVRLSRRPSQDSDTSLLAGVTPAMALAVAQLQRRQGVPTAASDHDQAEALQAARGSFGVLGLSLIMTEARGVKPLLIEEWPSDLSLWPIQKQFHLVTRVQTDPLVEDFVGFLFSEEASRVLTAHGHLIQRGS